MKLNTLTKEEEDVIVHGGTERPFSGKLDREKRSGIYLCRRCEAPLYRSQDKFDSGCGWPSFDDEIKGAVKMLPDPDGQRTEIRCARCDAHLGHVFSGEKLTEKDTRHCVNSLSMLFIADQEAEKRFDRLVLGGGCFWCGGAVFKQMRGSARIRPGYAGGQAKDPDYEQVCSGKSGHAEVVELLFDPEVAPLNDILSLFFKTHDPTTKDRQGNDRGTQYRSIILCKDEEQKEEVEAFIDSIRDDYATPIVTEAALLERFYLAESYHMDYFAKNPDKAYCSLVIAPKVGKARSLLEGR